MPCATLLLAVAVCSAAADTAPLPELPADLLAAQTQGVLLVDLERLDVTALQQAVAVGCRNWMYPAIERELDRLPEYRRRLFDAGVRVIALAALVEKSDEDIRMDRRLAVLCDSANKDAALRAVAECLAAYAPRVRKGQDGEDAADPLQRLTDSARWHGPWLCLSVSPWGEFRFPAKPGDERTQHLQSSLRATDASGITFATARDQRFLPEGASNAPDGDGYRVWATSLTVIRPKLGKRPELALDVTAATDQEATLLERHLSQTDHALRVLVGLAFVDACDEIAGYPFLPDCPDPTIRRDGRTFHISSRLRETWQLAIGANERPRPPRMVIRSWEVTQGKRHYRLTWEKITSSYHITKVEDLSLDISQHIRSWPHAPTEVRYDPDSDELLLIAQEEATTATRRLVHKYGVLWKVAEAEGSAERFTVAGKLTETRSPPAKPRSGYRPPRREGDEFGEWPIE